MKYKLNVIIQFSYFKISSICFKLLMRKLPTWRFVMATKWSANEKDASKANVTFMTCVLVKCSMTGKEGRKEERHVVITILSFTKATLSHQDN